MGGRCDGLFSGHQPSLTTGSFQAAHRQSLAGLILAHIECIYEFFAVPGEALFVMLEIRNDKHPPSYRVFV